MRLYLSLGVVAFSRIAFLITLNPLSGSIAQDFVENRIEVIDAGDIAPLLDVTEVNEQDLDEREVNDASSSFEAFTQDSTDIGIEAIDATEFASLADMVAEDPEEVVQDFAESEPEVIDATDFTPETDAAVNEADLDQILFDELSADLDKGKNAEGVIRRIDELSSEVKSRLPYQICLARAYVQVGRSDEAEGILIYLTSNYPSSVESFRLLGSYYIQNKRYNEAETYLARVIDMDRDNWKAFAGLGKIFLLRDDHKEKARNYLVEAVRLKPDDENLQFELAMILFHFDDHTDAKEALEAAERLNPEIDHKLIGKIYLHYKHIDWAAVSLEKSVIPYLSDPESGAIPDTEAMLLLAECNEILGNGPNAELLYEQTLLVQPHNALAHAGLGLLLLGTGSGNAAATNACGLNQDEALRHLSFALDLEKSVPLKAVEAARAFCEKEFDEVASWGAILDEKWELNEFRIALSKPDVAISIQPERSVTLSGVVFLPIRIVNRTIRFFARNLLYYTGICNENLMKKTDFSSFTGPLNKSLKNICTPPSSNNNDNNNNRKNKQAKQITNVENAEGKMNKAWDSRTSMTQVPRVRVESAEELFTEYISQNKPVIITNFQENWADSAVFTKAGLTERFGDNIVRVSVSETGRFDGPESGALWGLDPNTDVLVRPPATSMNLKDFFELTKSSNESANFESGESEDDAIKEIFYLEYLALSQYLGKPFLDLIPMPEQVLSSQYPLRHTITNLWIGVKPTTSPLHYDDDENFLCQILGTKEVILFPPQDLSNLYYVGRPKGTLEYKYPGKFTRDQSSITPHSVVFGSSVSVDKPDLLKYPLYAQATGVRVVLNPGDALYLPAYWHHEVQSLPDKIEGLNIAVNFWFKNVTSPIDDLHVLGISQ